MDYSLDGQLYFVTDDISAKFLHYGLSREARFPGLPLCD
jgi:hypothetical protein